ncbi:hypothetical protein [Sphingomonas sp.]|uniref:hypothetical protein n=1 Tax=Sphingomonas sp. TaxID=28214 RepID=UPI003D6DA781
MATPPKKPAPRRKAATARKPAAARKPNVTAAPIAPAEPKASTPKPAAAKTSAAKPSAAKPGAAKPRAAAKPKPSTGPRVVVQEAAASARDAVTATLGKAQQAIADASPARKWTAAAIVGGIGAAVTGTLLALRGRTPDGAKGKPKPKPGKKAD